MVTKLCKKCNKEKPLKEMVKHSSTSDGYLFQCKSCIREYRNKFNYPITLVEKKCSKCGKIKLAKEFSPSPRVLGGLHTWCRLCSNESHKQRNYYKDYRIKRKESFKNDPFFNQKIKDQSRKSRIKNIETSLLRNCKTRAKQKNLEFDLQKEDIVIPEYCPILLTKLECGTKENYTNSPSVDRIDNTKGYIKGNVQVISTKANKIKNEATIAELILLSEWINKTFINN